MISKSRVRVVRVRPLLVTLALAGCSDYANRAVPGSGENSGAVGTINAAGAAGTPMTNPANTGTAMTGTPAAGVGMEGNPVPGASITGEVPGAGAVGTGGAAGAGTGAAGTDSGVAMGPGGAPASGGSGGAGPVLMRGSGPCDIYAAGNTPCVAAYSMVRALSSTYNGPLYQVRRGAPDPNTGSGGVTQDIGMLADGFADAGAQDAFCGNQICTISVLYDQSGRGNHLTSGKAGCYEGTASEDDYESSATARALTANGHDVYALFTNPHEGYRDNTTSGMPTGNQAQGIYIVADGRRSGCCCCWDFGNGSTNNCYGPTGQMNAIYFGTGYWGRGAGNGPWYLGDFEAGVWAGGNGASNAVNPNSPSMTMDYAFGVLKTNATNYALRMGNAQTGNLTTAYDGAPPAQWTMQGGIILGIGGDNSNSSFGTFFEGAITAGRPSDATDQAVFQNVQAMRYGQ